VRYLRGIISRVRYLRAPPRGHEEKSFKGIWSRYMRYSRTLVSNSRSLEIEAVVEGHFSLKSIVSRTSFENTTLSLFEEILLEIYSRGLGSPGQVFEGVRGSGSLGQKTVPLEVPGDGVGGNRDPTVSPVDQKATGSCSPVALQEEVQVLVHCVHRSWSTVFTGPGPLCSQVLVHCAHRSWSTVFTGPGPLCSQVLVHCVHRSWSTVLTGPGPLCSQVLVHCVHRSWSTVFTGPGPLCSQVLVHCVYRYDSEISKLILGTMASSAAEEASGVTILTAGRPPGNSIVVIIKEEQG
ncbi:hypothetical protein Hamer_G012107, partial [Homarus americanus]